MPNIMKHGKEGIDFRRVELDIQPPNYNKNTQSRVVTPQFGGTEHLRPSKFPGYILANTNPIDMANQKNQIMHNFNYKCNQMEAKLSPKIKLGGSRGRRGTKGTRGTRGRKKRQKKQNKFTHKRRFKRRYKSRRKYSRKSRKNKR